MPFISLCQVNDLIQSINRFVQTIMFIEYNIYIIFYPLFLSLVLLFQMCLQTLKAEATNTMGIRFYRGSIVNVLKQWFPDLPRTKKSAYKYLKQKGYYDRSN